uniref:Uncharacterized protein n=1 Tax=Ditylenchus dipsaci TaxID=166011 RepID=A0A915EA80_9BILA
MRTCFGRHLDTITWAALFSFSLSGLQLLNFFVGSPASTCRVGNFSLAQAISRNGMIYFLVANLLTGLINMLSIPGQAISSAAPTTLFLMFYSFITAFIVYIVNMRREKRD